MHSVTPAYCNKDMRNF